MGHNATFHRKIYTYTMNQALNKEIIPNLDSYAHFQIALCVCIRPDAIRFL